MPRPIRVEFPGASYYITNRGVRGGKIFMSVADKNEFLRILVLVGDRFGWLVHGYVMMDDHYHLVVETPSPNLSSGMRQLSGVYTQYVNRKHLRSGALFEGRFRGILFEKDRYLQPLCRHVALNPVRSGRARNADDYRWSSHRTMTGSVNTYPFIHTADLLGSFGRRPADQVRRYGKYVSDGIGAPSPLEGTSNQILLGSEAFRQQMYPLLAGSGSRSRGPKRATRRRSLTSLFKGVEGKSKVERNALIVKAHHDYNYTLAAIGDHLGLHYTTVSKVVNG